MTVISRGTSNSNVRGSAASRRARKLWLLATFRANVDLYETGFMITETLLGMGEPACRCYRCGKLLTYETLEVDRIKPGCEGGTYARNNIRPACGDCNKITGNEAKARRRKP